MLAGDMTPDREAINKSHIIITTPEKWDGISRYWKSRKYVKKVGVIIFDEIHLLGLDRGPILEDKNVDENVRLLGLSTALANWLGVTHIGLYNLPAAQRPVPCQVHNHMQDGIEYLTWTFLFRRILKNPTYYQLDDIKATTINKYLRDCIMGFK